MHPFTPFITEEIWKELGDKPENLLITAQWPQIDEAAIDHESSDEMDWVIKLIGAIRSVRSEMNVPPSAQMPLLLNGASEVQQIWLKRNWTVISRMARISEYRCETEFPKAALEFVHFGATAALPIADVIDLEQEKQRLEKTIKKAEGELKKLSGKLSNEKFLANAPSEVVEENKRRLETEQIACDKLKQSLAKILAAL